MMTDCIYFIMKHEHLSLFIVMVNFGCPLQYNEGWQENGKTVFGEDVSKKLDR